MAQSRVKNKLAVFLIATAIVVLLLYLLFDLKARSRIISTCT
jgi:hypothetical protein